MGWKNIVIANLGVGIAFAGMAFSGANVPELLPGIMDSSVVAVGYILLMIVAFLVEEQI